MINPRGRPMVGADSDHYFRTSPSVRPHFSKYHKTKQISSENSDRYWQAGLWVWRSGSLMPRMSCLIYIIINMICCQLNLSHLPSAPPPSLIHNLRHIDASRRRKIHNSRATEVESSQISSSTTNWTLPALSRHGSPTILQSNSTRLQSYTKRI